MARWNSLVNMYWAKAYWCGNDERTGEAEAELLKAMQNPPSNDELCEVVRWMAGPEGDQKTAPTLKQLIRSVYLYRRPEGSGTASACGVGCDMCKQGDTDPTYGWLYPHTDMWPGHTVGVPCNCSAGEWVAKHCAPYTEYAGGKWEMLSNMRADAEFAVRTGSVFEYKKYYEKPRGAQNGMDVAERATG